MTADTIYRDEDDVDVLYCQPCYEDLTQRTGLEAISLEAARWPEPGDPGYNRGPRRLHCAACGEELA